MLLFGIRDRPRHVADHLHLDVLVAVRVQLRADLAGQIHPVHVGLVTDVVLRRDLVWQNRAGRVGVHVAAPDAVEVERRFRGLHPHDSKGSSAMIAGYAEVLRHLFEVAVRRPASSAAQRLRVGGTKFSFHPLISGVLPSADTSEASILICRQAGLSTERLLAP